MNTSANHKSANQHISKSQVLDLLLEALEERQAARRSAEEQGSQGAEERRSKGAEEQGSKGAEEPRGRGAEEQGSKGAEERRSKGDEFPSMPEPPPEPRPGEEGWSPSPLLPSVHLGRTLGRLLLVVALLVVLVNVPINRHGTSLARMMPDSASLVIRDGLVIKGSGPDIYVLQDDRLRWISSLEAFEFFGYRWEQVHVVEDSFLERFEKGRPLHVLLKCQGSPHIYALENGQKRWIKDIPTFEGEGYVWEDVKTVDCVYLRSLPDGPPIPEDAGPPPQP